MPRAEDYSKDWFSKFISYDPETGRFTTVANRQARWVGKDPCSADKGGYLRLSVRNKVFLAHRVAFVMMGRKVPAMVDHVNRRRSDNRWKNLRAVDHVSTNLLNSDSRTSRDLPPNVYHRGGGKFRVMIVVRPHHKHDLGSFGTVVEAVKARDAKRKELGLPRIPK